jgi:anaerobic magnesium-protoporphyrin IX monomethyl ester cyclase
MTNVLLIYPVPSIASPQKSPPLSILYVGEALKQARLLGKTDESFDVRYFDERYESAPDLDWADIVGVSSMTGYQLKGAMSWLKASKAAGKRTILGGIHVTMQTEQCLEEKYIDNLVVGEGEWAILDAIAGARVAKRPLAGEHVSPVSRDTLVHFQRSARTGDTVLMTSRGCPFRCGFCYVQKFYDRHWEPVDMERWRKDILYLKVMAGVTKLEHGDDWIGKWSRAREIITYLKDHGIQYRPSIRAHQITDDVAREMAGLGIQHVSIGMETASPRILKLVEKDITPEDQFRCAEALAKYGIWPLYYWITGFPTETEQERNETLDAADRMARIHKGKLTQDVYAYTALPGSKMFDLADQSKLPQTMEGWSNYSLHQTHNEIASNLYHIGGFYFHRAKGDKTSRNFPGWRRLLIAPFETLIWVRWKMRYFKHFRLEKKAIEALLRWATRRQV